MQILSTGSTLSATAGSGAFLPCLRLVVEDSALCRLDLALEAVARGFSPQLVEVVHGMVALKPEDRIPLDDALDLLSPAADLPQGDDRFDRHHSLTFLYRPVRSSRGGTRKAADVLQRARLAVVR